MKLIESQKEASKSLKINEIAFETFADVTFQMEKGKNIKNLKSESAKSSKSQNLHS